MRRDVHTVLLHVYPHVYDDQVYTIDCVFVNFSILTHHETTCVYCFIVGACILVYDDQVYTTY